MPLPFRLEVAQLMYGDGLHSCVLKFVFLALLTVTQSTSGDF